MWPRRRHAPITTPGCTVAAGPRRLLSKTDPAGYAAKQLCYYVNLLIVHLRRNALCLTVGSVALCVAIPAALYQACRVPNSTGSSRCLWQ